MMFSRQLKDIDFNSYFPQGLASADVFHGQVDRTEALQQTRKHMFSSAEIVYDI
jgi:hypothetical protein